MGKYYKYFSEDDNLKFNKNNCCNDCCNDHCDCCHDNDCCDDCCHKPKPPHCCPQRGVTGTTGATGGTGATGATGATGPPTPPCAKSGISVALTALEQAILEGTTTKPDVTISALNQMITGTIETVTTDIVTVVTAQGTFLISICNITLIDFQKQQGGLDVIFTPACDPNAIQCDCDDGVHDVIEAIGIDPFTLSVVQNNNSTLSNVTTELLCNDVVWVEDANTMFIVPLNTIFFVQ